MGPLPRLRQRGGGGLPCSGASEFRSGNLRCGHRVRYRRCCGQREESSRRPRRQTREGDAGGGGGGGHVRVAGPRLGHRTGLHHQPGVCRVAAPAGQNHKVAPARPQVDHDGHRPLYHPLHHHSYRQVGGFPARLEPSEALPRGREGRMRTDHQALKNGDEEFHGARPDSRSRMHIIK